MRTEAWRLREVTDEPLRVAPDLLGRPLATPWRRGAALAVDLLIYGTITIGLLLATMAAAIDRVQPPFLEEVRAHIAAHMGFFSLDLARMVGVGGRVVCVDVEPRVLATLRHRAHRQGLLDRLDVRTCAPDDPAVNDLAGTIDVVVAHHVIHETSDPARVLDRLAAALRPGGLLYLAEPRRHVSPELFTREVNMARQAGLVPEVEPRATRQMTAVFRKPSRALRA